MGETRTLSIPKALIWLFSLLLAAVMIVCIPHGSALAAESADANAQMPGQVLVGAIQKGYQATPHAAGADFAAPAKKASKSGYAILMKNGYVYPCNKNGKRLSDTWKGGSTFNHLLIAADVKKVPSTFLYRYLGAGGVSMELKTATFLLKGGKNSCKTIAADCPFGGQKALKTVKNFNKTKVKTIGKYAFAQTGIASITLPKTLVTIGEGAFMQCTKLKKVAFPKSLKYVKDNAFRKDAKLKTLSKFNKTKVVSIGVDAFAETGITSIAVPKTLKTIGEEAFAATKSLKSVKGLSGSRLEAIGKLAFYQSGVTSLVLPASCKSIDYAAFYNASALKSLTVKSATLVSGSSQMLAGSGISNSLAPGSIKVPATLISSYKQSLYWKDYAVCFAAI